MKREVKRGLVLGRFQPIHNGHLELIRVALQENDEVIVMIAAAQYSHSVKNPFNASERYQMIRQALIEEWGQQILNRIHIIPVFDINDNALWVTHLERILPPFTCVYANNPFTTLLFKEKGYEVKQIGLVNREEYSGTQIRARILQGKKVTEIIPPSVQRFLEEINALERLKACTETDEDPKTKN